MVTGRFTNAVVFDGDVLHRPATLVVEDGRVSAIEPGVASGGVDCEGLLLAPGFIDLQVNGGADLLFGVEPTGDALRLIATAHEALGTTHLLPTVISGTPEELRAGRDAVAGVISGDEAEGAVLGIHYEGPTISSQRLGAHPAGRQCDLPIDDDRLWRLPEGAVVRATLAPEVTRRGDIGRLAAMGVLVAVGHTDATVEETRAAIAEGANCATHLFNAMPPVRARQPGAAGAFLDSDDAWVSVIADGVHVDAALLRIATRAKPPGKLFAVSDAMPPVGGSSDHFQLGDSLVTVVGDRCVLDDGRLAGAAEPLAAAVRVLVTSVGLVLEEALRMVSRYPAEYAGLGGRLGRLAPGYEATATILDDELTVRGVIRRGRLRWC